MVVIVEMEDVTGALNTTSELHLSSGTLIEEEDINKFQSIMFMLFLVFAVTLCRHGVAPSTVLCSDSSE